MKRKPIRRAPDIDRSPPIAEGLGTCEGGSGAGLACGTPHNARRPPVEDLTLAPAFARPRASRTNPRSGLEPGPRLLPPTATRRTRRWRSALPPPRRRFPRSAPPPAPRAARAPPPAPPRCAPPRKPHGLGSHRATRRRASRRPPPPPPPAGPHDALRRGRYPRPRGSDPTQRWRLGPTPRRPLRLTLSSSPIITDRDPRLTEPRAVPPPSPRVGWPPRRFLSAPASRRAEASSLSLGPWWLGARRARARAAPPTPGPSWA